MSNVQCSITACGNNTLNTKKLHRSIEFYSFPKNLILQRKWLDVVGKHPSWRPSQASRVCSDHFTATCFEKRLSDGTADLMKLKPDAIPTIISVEYLTNENRIEIPDMRSSPTVTIPANEKLSLPSLRSKKRSLTMDQNSTDFRLKRTRRDMNTSASSLTQKEQILNKKEDDYINQFLEFVDGNPVKSSPTNIADPPKPSPMIIRNSTPKILQSPLKINDCVRLETRNDEPHNVESHNDEGRNDFNFEEIKPDLFGKNFIECDPDDMDNNIVYEETYDPTDVKSLVDTLTDKPLDKFQMDAVTSKLLNQLNDKVDLLQSSVNVLANEVTALRDDIKQQAERTIRDTTQPQLMNGFTCLPVSDIDEFRHLDLEYRDNKRIQDYFKNKFNSCAETDCTKFILANLRSILTGNAITILSHENFMNYNIIVMLKATTCEFFRTATDEFVTKQIASFFNS